MNSSTLYYAVIWEKPDTRERGVDCVYGGGDYEEQKRIACLQAEERSRVQPELTWLVECQVTKRVEVARWSAS